MVDMKGFAPAPFGLDTRLSKFTRFAPVPKKSVGVLRDFATSADCVAVALSAVALLVGVSKLSPPKMSFAGSVG